LDEPADPAHHRTGHRPLLTVTVVHKHRNAPTECETSHERQTVLGVDDHIAPRPPQRTEADPRRDHRQPRPDIDGVAAAGAADLAAVFDLKARRTPKTRSTTQQPHTT